MSNRKKMVLMLSIICAAVVLVYVFNFLGAATNTTPEPLGTSPVAPEDTLFVVPENPLGTLGLFSALAASFGVFVLKKKRVQS